eukprot:jgi/Mesen1/10494/ME000083S09995
MSKQGRPEAVSKAIDAVGFGFYSPAEVHAISVKRLTNPQLFDNLRNPMPDGLYDPALGPIDPHGSCTTCRLGYAHCPGHFGHIDLALPVYNPLVLPVLLKLLRATCLNCHHFKMASAQVRLFEHKLRLLALGRLVEAATIPTTLSQLMRKKAAKKKKTPKKKKAKAPKKKKALTKKPGGGEEGGFQPGEEQQAEGAEEDEEEAEEEEEEEEEEEDDDDGGGDIEMAEREGEESRVDALKALASSLLHQQQQLDGSVEEEGGHGGGGKCRGKVRWTSHAVGAAKALTRQLLAQMPASKCANCGAHNPNLRREGYSKIFKMPVGGKHAASNAAKGIEFPDVLHAATHADDDDVAPSRRDSPPAGKDVTMGDDAPAGASGAVDFEEPTKERESSSKGGEEEAGAQEEKKSKKHLYITPAEKHMVTAIVPTAGAAGAAGGDGGDASIFFLRALFVPPNRYRPVNKVGDMLVEHPQNVFYGRILQANMYLTELGRSAASAANSMQRATASWVALQTHVNCLLDSSLGGAKKVDAAGIRQQLEKKEGLFRMNMMGKRVNHACRSVISPDPYIRVNEIGIPPYFAMRLSYPELVTDWNAEELRELVVRGPRCHPGATHVEDEKGNLIALQGLSDKKRLALSRTLLSKPGAAAAAAAPVGDSRGGSVAKAVYRHLRDGDAVLVNRQPTLHKPGIMAHMAKILKGEKTLRLHYANCNVYNADFDGDEMNVHFPQDPMGRAEAYGIVNADEQYIVPTSGTPARGLIQDHIVGATLLTMTGTMLEKEEYQQLLYAACLPRPTPVGPGTGGARESSSKVAQVAEEAVLPVAPAVWKPRPLWTGKQVLTTVLNHLTRGQKPMRVEAKAKVAAHYWGAGRGEEGALVVHDNELLAGAFDKAQFGRFGLVHAFQELYGSQAAGALLPSSMQCFGDASGTPTGAVGAKEGHRVEEGQAVLTKGHALPARSVVAVAAAAMWGEQAREGVAQLLRTRRDAGRAVLDNRMISALSRITSEATGSALPHGQLKPFPANCMSLMTVTGAKGSAVNFNQISALLGQQELEGKRVPRMASGKTLPCFAAWAPQARAGGYISDRFLTGLRPQEYYFHCMAGRDGLVDTTVKTSRSGYLQRCLVKNLEGLRLHYDHTVRDADASVVQFRYGGDALDATKTSYLENFDFLLQNKEQVATRLNLDQVQEAGLRHLDDDDAAPAASEARGDHRGGARVLLDEHLPGSTWGAVSTAYAHKMDAFLQGLGKAGRRKLQLAGRGERARARQLLELKYARSLAEAGEPVGVLAAQSVGEPSTQMTLNTFHFAGRGEANVTLGIPRLREILMTAARVIATPVMECPLLPGVLRATAEQLASKLQRLTLAELMQSIRITEHPSLDLPGVGNTRTYAIAIHFYAPHRYPRHLGIAFEDLEGAFRTGFVPRIQLALKRALAKAKGKGASHDVLAVPVAQQGATGGDGDGEEGGEEEGAGGKRGRGRPRGGAGLGNEVVDEDDDNEEGGEDEGTDAEKRRAQGNDDRVYDDEEDPEERQVADATRLEAEQQDWGMESGDNDDEEEEEEREGEPQRTPAGKATHAHGQEGPTGDGGEIDDGDEEEGDEEEEQRQLMGGVRSKGPPGKAKKGAGSAKEQKKKKGVVKAKAKKGGKAKEEAAVGVVEEVRVGAYWCEVQLSVALDTPQILLHELVEKVTAQVVVRATPGITRCAVLDDPLRLQVEGLNFDGLMQFDDELDLNHLTTNHIAAVLTNFGVEAARATIVKEVQKVFGMYGINVDARHLELIADFMTYEGEYRACNRIGIESSPSPFLKMTFETALHFLMDATLQGNTDDLDTPSARIVLGQVVDVGTGSFDLLQNLRI